MKVTDIGQFDQTLANLVKEGLIEESCDRTVRFYRIKDRGKHWFTRDQILSSIL